MLESVLITRVWHEAFTLFSQIKALTGWRMLSNNDIFALLGEEGEEGGQQLRPSINKRLLRQGCLSMPKFCKFYPPRPHLSHSQLSMNHIICQLLACTSSLTRLLACVPRPGNYSRI